MAFYGVLTVNRSEMKFLGTEDTPRAYIWLV
jgi:hypothetical protein